MRRPVPGRLLRRATLPVAMALLACAAAAETPGRCAPWHAWNEFRATLISADGRVIDTASPHRHTVSEGQAYALVFALAAGDRDTFATLLRWTENNLAQGDLSRQLPAWQWGRRDDGDWGPLDANSATDADLWLAWALAEAGRRWHAPHYHALSQSLAARVLDTSVVELPGLGPVLLPAPQGFRAADGAVRLNPAYLPIQVLRGLATAHAGQRSRWEALIASSAHIIEHAAPRGFAADWVRVDARGRFDFAAPAGASGGYDAIRVYLWLGLLPAADPLRARLLRRFRPMARLIRRDGMPPERIDAVHGRVLSRRAPGAFSAAVAPWLEVADPASARRQWRRVAAQMPAPDAYYGRALLLFAQGWREGRLRFTLDGRLQPEEAACAAHAQ